LPDEFQNVVFVSAADGEVRPVILSELGYSSSQGEINQAAAFAYAYYAAENNPYINAILLSRQTDAGEEIAQGLALGLSTQGGPPDREFYYTAVDIRILENL